MTVIVKRFSLGVALLFLVVPVVYSSKRIRKDNDPNSRRFTVRNLSTSSVEVYWMNLATEERVLQFDLVPGGSDTLNSHAVHEFEIREKANENGECNGKKGKCRKKYFQITEDEDQGNIESVKVAKVKASSSRTRAKERARDALKDCRDLGRYLDDSSVASPLEQLDRLTECMQDNVHESIYATQDEIYFQADIRRRMGSQLKSYACNDPDYPATKPLSEKEWNPNNPRLKMDDQSHTVKVLLQAGTTMIALIENMVTPSDCEVMQALSNENEEDPTVVPWESRKDPVTLDILSRILAYVNPAVALMNLYAGLPEKGQAIFKFYHGSSMFSQETNERKSSSGIWPVGGPLFARLLIFCEVPEESGGGAIHFPESGAHVHPKQGEALLVTYTRPPLGLGHIEKFANVHTECPILKGNRIVLQHQFRLFPNPDA